jgi:hypothetical protein
MHAAQAHMQNSATYITRMNFDGSCNILKDPSWPVTVAKQGASCELGRSPDYLVLCKDTKCLITQI